MSVGIQYRKHSVTVRDDSSKHLPFPLLCRATFWIQRRLNVGPIVLKYCVIFSQQRLNQVMDIPATIELNGTEKGSQFARMLSFPSQYHRIRISVRRFINLGVTI